MLVPCVGAAQTAAAPAPQATANAQQPAKAAPEPDYPDPRSLQIGLFYWQTVPGVGPDIRGGVAATGYSSIYGLGKDKPAEGAVITYPVTRTGTLGIEAFVDKGTGNQFAPKDTTIFGNSFVKNDSLSTQYQITTAKLYLDDLLYPHKFPVSKLRFKSLWAVRYLKAQATVDAPLSNSTTGTTGTGNRQLVLPEFGAAMEYALAKHVLFRVEASGFGIPKKSYIWDGAATVSYRRGQVTVEGGFKGLGFKTSPAKDEYIPFQIYGGFVGVRYNWK